MLIGGADWWSVGDAEVFWRYAAELEDIPTIWTHEDSLRRINSRASGALKSLTYHRCEREPWTTLSATAALKLAIALGADRIDCYGVGMAGELNYDGTREEGAIRTEVRWARERGIWESIKPTDVEIIRHGSN